MEHKHIIFNGNSLDELLLWVLCLLPLWNLKYGMLYTVPDSNTFELQVVKDTYSTSEVLGSYFSKLKHCFSIVLMTGIL